MLLLYKITWHKANKTATKIWSELIDTDRFSLRNRPLANK